MGDTIAAAIGTEINENRVVIIRTAFAIYGL